MSDRPWHKRYHENAIGGYMGLSLEERGAYSTLLDYMYDRRHPLPANMRMLAGYLDVSVRKAGAVVESLVKKGKLYRLEDGRFSNRRFEKELENDARVADHMASIGSKGGRISADGKKNTKENKGHPKQTVKPSSSSLEPELKLEERKKETSQVPTRKASADAKKARLPENFPTTEAKGAAIVHWNKNGRPDLSANVEDQAAQFRDHHTAHGKKMEDWAAAWRTWIRNALQMTRPPRVTLGVVSAPAPPDQATWVRRLVYFYEGDEDAGVDVGYWSAQFGPKPGQPCCKVPPEAIAAYRARKPPSAATGGP